MELKLSILISKTKFVRKGISTRKLKKETSPLNSAYSLSYICQISAKIDNFGVLDQICREILLGS